MFDGWCLDYAHSADHDDTYCIHHNASSYDIDCDPINCDDAFHGDANHDDTNSNEGD